MTANHEHTPTTEQVRELYAVDEWGVSHDEYRAEFDRWYQAEIAAAEQRVAARGWDEGCSAGLDAGLTIGEISMGLSNRRIPAPPENPYRADQMEGDDETH